MTGTTTLLAAAAWLLLALPWFVLDGWIAGSLNPGLLTALGIPTDVVWVPDLTVVLLVVAGVHVRPHAATVFLVFAAGARSLVMDGPLSLHFLALALPTAVLLAVRQVVVERSWTWRIAAAVFLAIVVPRTTAFLGRLSGDAVPAVSVGFGTVVRAAVWGPLLAALLVRLPPWRGFCERRPTAADAAREGGGR
jgi:hypothetical protein